MGGGNLISALRPPPFEGLSPRGRGKRQPLSVWTDAGGSIPAWAGETCHRRCQARRLGVYPRVGGGNLPICCQSILHKGLSPRGRGKLLAQIGVGVSNWSIPAWAGETDDMTQKAHYHAVYPRVGGGNDFLMARYGTADGLSPRGRGKRNGEYRVKGWRRSIPAWAGETRGARRGADGRAVYPRVGGGNLTASSFASHISGLSPRGRGKRPRSPLLPSLPGSIPAWAGETSTQSPRPLRSAVYPRVGGGNVGSRPDNVNNLGLSPRGRGKLARAGSAAVEERSIPAWAGETGGTTRR